MLIKIDFRNRDATLKYDWKFTFPIFTLLLVINESHKNQEAMFSKY